MNKKNILFMLLLMLSIGMKAQINIIDLNAVFQTDSIDQARLVVQYEMKYVKDTTNEKQLLDPLKETLMLEIGQKASKCYSYTFYQRDSVLTADYKAGASQETITQHAQAYGNGNISYQIFKNYPTGKVTTTDRLGTTNILCEETNERPEWQLHPDTMTILSYACQKATCRFKGRDYTAWYTMDVPISEGPWKLHGLPGLIIKAEDSRGHFAFTCTGLEQSREAKPILIHTKGREKLNRKELDKMYERFYTDPIGFLAATSPNVTINITDGQGNPIKKFSEPYNPIELNK